jgi:uncharacterized membrane protein
MIAINRRNASRLLLFALYFSAGINHFVMPDFYYPLMPNYLPQPLLLNQLSGAAEMLLALGLLWAPTKRLAAWGIVLLLLAFVPAHVWMITEGGCFAPASFCLPVWVMWVRLLLLHPLLMVWAWREATARH